MPRAIQVKSPRVKVDETMPQLQGYGAFDFENSQNPHLAPPHPVQGGGGGGGGGRRIIMHIGAHKGEFSMAASELSLLLNVISVLHRAC